MTDITFADFLDRLAISRQDAGALRLTPIQLAESFDAEIERRQPTMPMKPKLYLAGVADADLAKYAVSRGCELLVMIYQWRFGGDQPGVIDVTRLERVIEEEVPEGFGGVVHCNFERPNIVSRMNSTTISADSPLIAADMVQRMKIADTMRRLRPGVRWGNWGDVAPSKWPNKALVAAKPGVLDWSRLSNTEKRTQFARWQAPVFHEYFNAPGFVSMPNLYDNYPDDAPDFKQWQSDVVLAHYEAALQLNEFLGFPKASVLPHFNVRFGGDTYTMRRIPQPELYAARGAFARRGYASAAWGLDVAPWYCYQADEPLRSRARLNIATELERAGIKPDFEANESAIREYLLAEAYLTLDQLLAWEPAA